MIGHDNRDPEVELDTVVVQAAFEHEETYSLGENPAVIGAESHEMLLIIALKMRKLPPVKSLWHSGLVMWGQSPSAVRGAKLRSEV